MGLLGKTLKGRTTKASALVARANVVYRNQHRTTEEIDEERKKMKSQLDEHRKFIAEEQKLSAYNQKKLLAYWRKIMRIAKTESLQNEIEIYSQNNQRELDSKEAFIQMLDKNLDEAEDQYQIALRNHLIHIEQLLALQNSRLRGLAEEFDRDVDILRDEFVREKEDIARSHQRQKKELDDLYETFYEEEKKKEEEEENDHQGFREEIKNKDSEDLDQLRTALQAKQRKIYNELEHFHQKYTTDTQLKTQDYKLYYDKDKAITKEIDKYVREIKKTKDKIEYMRLKIYQHTKECNLRNQALRKEKENIHKNYTELKAKMLKFREDEAKRLTELSLNSKKAVEKLKETLKLSEKILKTAELCRRLETEKEKVLPFYESSVELEDIPEDLRSAFNELTPEDYEEYSYLNNFFKRYNKVLLDKLAIEKQKASLQKENVLLKSLLKQYLDGISLNEDVLKQDNPLLIVNNKINIKQLPVAHVDVISKQEASAIVQNLEMHSKRVV
eukprot:TRINITY_DN12672_c0_g1_i1.p1 TRINITY_DN12672_c0_g1~~TRINITY_DN12672_c0_g1_i1.p1  ORF type:complete len:501 (-),score=153.10 TRINITY_DN12672_c0_g1_i1:36-1538(-)